MKIERESTLDLYRTPAPCEWCGRFMPRREAAHVFARGMGGGSQLDIEINLVGLGPAVWGCGCHHASHNGKPPTKADLLRVVSAREGVPVDAIIDTVYLLLRSPKGTDWEGILEGLYARFAARPRNVVAGPADRPGRREGEEGVPRPPTVARPVPRDRLETEADFWVDL